jgi:hypothetical protein
MDMMMKDDYCAVSWKIFDFLKVSLKVKVVEERRFFAEYSSPA